MKLGRSVSSAVAAHAALTTGVHGVGVSTVASLLELTTHTGLITGVHGYEMVRKTADKTLNNVAVLENDNHLLLALLANEVWQIDIFILCQGDANANIKFGLSYPVGCVIWWGCVGAGGAVALDTWGATGVGGNQQLLAEDAAEPGGITNVSPAGYRFSLIVINGANAGNVNLQWCQNLAQVADTTVFENSCLIAHQLA